MMEAMKTYFTAPLSSAHQFHAGDSACFVEWHAVPLDDNDPNGEQLIVARFRDEGMTEEWLKMPGVTPLPHPMNNSKTISTDHHGKLKSKFGASPTDTVWDVANKAGKIHPCFRLTAFW